MRDAAQQVGHGAPLCLAAQVPQGQVHAAEGHDGEALATEGKGGLVHGPPVLVDRLRVGAEQPLAQDRSDHVDPGQPPAADAVAG